MKKVTVIRYTKLADKSSKAANIGGGIGWLWSLTGALFPALFIYMITLHGSPALLISERHYQCGYLDIFGGFYTKAIQGNCPWYGFRDIQIIPIEVNRILEARQ